MSQHDRLPLPPNWETKSKMTHGGGQWAWAAPVSSGAAHCGERGRQRERAREWHRQLLRSSRRTVFIRNHATAGHCARLRLWSWTEPLRTWVQPIQTGSLGCSSKQASRVHGTSTKRASLGGRSGYKLHAVLLHSFPPGFESPGARHPLPWLARPVSWRSSAAMVPRLPDSSRALDASAVAAGSRWPGHGSPDGLCCRSPAAAQASAAVWAEKGLATPAAPTM